MESTGPEIWAQTEGRIDAFVACSGTGGTLAGTSEYLKSRNARDPHRAGRSARQFAVRIRPHGEVKATGKGSITEGIGIGRVTDNFKDAPVDSAVHVEDAETVTMVYRLLREEGLFLGTTSGINVAAAVRVARDLGPGHTVVTILCDGGAKYVSRLYDRGLAGGTRAAGCRPGRRSSRLTAPEGKSPAGTRPRDELFGRFPVDSR